MAIRLIDLSRGIQFLSYFLNVYLDYVHVLFKIVQFFVTVGELVEVGKVFVRQLLHLVMCLLPFVFEHPTKVINLLLHLLKSLTFQITTSYNPLILTAKMAVLVVFLLQLSGQFLVFVHVLLEFSLIF